MIKGQYKGEKAEGMNLCQLVFIPYSTSKSRVTIIKHESLHIKASDKKFKKPDYFFFEQPEFWYRSALKQSVKHST